MHAENKLLRISANAISYGWLGDVLHDSEHYRCMGPIRYQYSGVKYFMEINNKIVAIKSIKFIAKND